MHKVIGSRRCGRNCRLIRRWVLLASLLGALSSGHRDNATDGPLRDGPVSAVPHQNHPSATVGTPDPSLRGVRGKYLRMRLDVPVDLAVPEPGQVALDLSDSRRGCPHYAGMPRLEREHISPPATGPPGAGALAAPSPPQFLRKTALSLSTLDSCA